MDEVRRDDGELCGYVAEVDGRWRALTVFGGALGDHGGPTEARAQVLAGGLAALSERWMLVDRATGAEEVVCIQEASPERVTLALGWYSMPGVPTRTLSAAEVVDGPWELRRG